MSLFLLTFLLVYGGVHAYVFFKTRSALSLGTASTVMIILFFVLMVISPILVRIAERHGHESAAVVVAHVGYTWMGFLFLFFCVSLVLDIYHLLLFMFGKLSHRPFAGLALPTAAAFCVPLAIAAAVSVYGWFEARNLKVERLTIVSPKIPSSAKKLVLVQISDLHLGLMVGKERLGRVLEKVRAEKPDVVVSSGDLVDGQLDGLAAMVPLLQNLQPPMGKYAVTGNHEFYAGLPQALSFTEQAGFRLLRHQFVSVGDVLTLVGVDDPAAHGGTPSLFPEHVLLAGLPQDRFTLLLKHRPVMDPASLGLFDLQLSGHVHKGQIFPFNLLTHLFYPVKMGFSRYPNNSSLYVSRGTGTWGPPIRFLSPPEIAVITFVPAK